LDHRLKHDGYRILAWKEGDDVRLWSRNGRDWSAKFVAIAAALRELPGAFILAAGWGCALAMQWYKCCNVSQVLSILPALTNIEGVS
jgi:hypothetical protein